MDKRLIKERDNGSWRGVGSKKVVIVLSFFVLIIATYTIPRATQVFFLQHIGIQDMVVAENKNQSHVVIVKVVHCKL